MAARGQVCAKSKREKNFGGADAVSTEESHSRNHKKKTTTPTGRREKGQRENGTFRNQKDLYMIGHRLPFTYVAEISKDQIGHIEGDVG